MNIISGIEDLHKRGYIEDININGYKSLSKEQLLILLSDDSAVKRSIAARIISIKYGVIEKELANTLLKKLSIEKRLYTRLEICSALEKGNEITAREMTNYIGKIGNNQHKKLPERPSLKKSFPLPRDLIARSLGRMNVAIMSVLNKVLESEDITKISEVLDAIGFLTFYNETTAKQENLDMILKTIEKYKDNSIIVWKSIICLSSFPLKDSVKCLSKFVDDNSNMLFVEEAKRALRIMKRPLLDDF